ncbi:MAG: hypothetical protein Q8Q50_00405 [Methylobacter sp.]|nr:hypothetical protein [Methylobacter sp.]
MTNYLQAFLEIGENLDAGGHLKKSHRLYLVQVTQKIKAGAAIDEAFQDTAPQVFLRGKQSAAYQAANNRRNELFHQACELIGGGPWHQCAELCRLMAVFINRKKYESDFQPESPVDCLIDEVLKMGIRYPTKCRDMYNLLFRTKND